MFGKKNRLHYGVSQIDRGMVLASMLCVYVYVRINVYVYVCNEYSGVGYKWM